MKCLNLGCGSRFHPDFVNIDIAYTSPYVKAHDITRGIPFSDGFFDVVYHSHLLEHLRKDQALELLRECHRVLKAQGITRIAVPDLEQIARTYLYALEKALENRPEWQANYDWIMLELYDQSVRDRAGGAMLDYLKQNPIPNEAFVYRRIGSEALRILQGLRERSARNVDRAKAARRFFARLRSLPQRVRHRFVRILLSDKEYQAFEAARFRSSGEIHLWMYDRHSLASLLVEAGFCKPTKVSAHESQIPGWPSYFLDTDADGVVYKPDSLFMEAVKI